MRPVKEDSKEAFMHYVPYLNVLPASDFDYIPGIDRHNPNFFVVSDIANETKRKVYLNDGFKKLLKEYVDHKYDIKMDKVTDEYSESIYRKMYYKDLAVNPSYHLYTRIMDHPDVTKSDYEFVLKKISQMPRNVVYSELSFIMLMVLSYYKTPFGRKLSKNIGLGVAVLGTAPVFALFGFYQANMKLIDWKLKQSKLDTKYHLKT